MIGGVDVDADHPVDIIGVEVERIAEQREACVDHQDIERPAFAHPRDHRVAVTAVGRHRMGAGLGRERLGGVLRPVIGKDHLGAIGGETADDRRPDTATAAEDENGFSSKIGHWRLLAY